MVIEIPNSKKYPSSGYRRVLLKLSGEVLMGDQSYGIDPAALDRIAMELQEVKEQGVEICVVLGGGNIFRGASNNFNGLDRSTGDDIGMLATVINALALQSTLEYRGIRTRVQSAVPMATICESYIRRRAIRHMEKGRIVLFAAGIGNPYFTTDTAAALRASEMNCDAMLKGTKVNGVYSSDPNRCAHAQRYKQVSYRDMLVNSLEVMDSSSIALARDNSIPILVFSIQKRHALAQVLAGTGEYTLITKEDQ